MTKPRTPSFRIIDSKPTSGSGTVTHRTAKISTSRNVKERHPSLVDTGRIAARIKGTAVVQTTSSLLTSKSIVSPRDGELGDLVAVSIPVWKTPLDVFERALASILNQTHKNIVVLVSSDGEDSPSYLGSKLINDPRVVTFRSPENHGPYWYHHIAWMASGAPFFAVQDADDVSDPNRIAELLRGVREYSADVAFPSVVDHRSDGSVSTIVPSQDRAVIGRELRHPMDHFWLVRSSFIKAIGGYYCGTKMGADSLLTSMAVMLGRCVAVPSARYHRYSRDGSLTRHPDTGHRSKQRDYAKRKLQGIWDLVRRCDRQSQVQEAISVARGEVENMAILEAVQGLRSAMSSASKTQHRSSGGKLDEVLDAACFTDWSITRQCAVELYNEVKRLNSRSIIDFGSGVSTLVFALYASETGAKVVSLETDKKWMEVTSSSLRKLGLIDHVSLIHAPLRNMTHHKISNRSYDFDFGVGKLYDFAFIDGPPESVGRHGTLPSIANHLAPNWHAWLHDGARPGERECVALWSKNLPVQFSSRISFAEDSRGVFKLSSQTNAGK